MVVNCSPKGNYIKWNWIELNWIELNWMTCRCHILWHYMQMSGSHHVSHLIFWVYFTNINSKVTTVWITWTDGCCHENYTPHVWKGLQSIRVRTVKHFPVDHWLWVSTGVLMLMILHKIMSHGVKACWQLGLFAFTK